MMYKDMFGEVIAHNTRYWRERTAKDSLDALRAERANLLKALTRALGTPGTRGEGLALAIDAYALAELQGWWQEWQAYLEAGLAVPDLDATQEAQVRSHLGELACWLGDYTTAQVHLARALDLWQEGTGAPAQPAGLAYTLSVLSLVYSTSGQAAQAVTCCEQAAACLEPLPTSGPAPVSPSVLHLLGRIHNNWGLVCQDQEAYGDALEHYAHAERLWQQSHQDQKLPRLWHNRGLAYWRLKCLDEAAAAFERAYAGHMHNGDEGRAARALHMQAVLAHARGNHLQALDLAARVKPFYQRIGDQYDLTQLANDCGVFYMSLERFAQAESNLQQAIRLWQSIDNPVEHARTLYNLGELYYLCERLPKARTTLHRALKLLHEVPSTQASLQGWIQDLLSQIENSDSSSS